MPRFLVCAYPLAVRVRPVSPLVREVIAGERDRSCHAGSTDRSRVVPLAERVAVANPKADGGGNLEGTFPRVCRGQAAPHGMPASCDGPATAPDLLIRRGKSGDVAAGQAIDAVPFRANV